MFYFYLIFTMLHIIIVFYYYYVCYVKHFEQHFMNEIKFRILIIIRISSPNGGKMIHWHCSGLKDIVVAFF